MKKSNTKQRLSLLDLPPPIPAALNTLNLDYVADTYKPGHYEISDLPDKIPIIDEKTGSFRRFIKKKLPRKDKRRVVSAPPGTFKDKQLPQPPASTSTSTSSSPTESRPFSVTPRSVSLINENIPPVLTTPGHNPRNSLIIEEDASLKLYPQPSNDSSEDSSILSNIVMPMAFNDPKEQEVNNLETNSFVDSLFSDDKPLRPQSMSSNEEIATPIVEKPLNLPKTREKSKVRFQDKPSAYKVKPNCMNYCLDIPQTYSDSRFPLVPKYSHLDDKRMSSQPETKEKHNRSFSDRNHFKVHLVDNPLTAANKQEKRRSFTDFSGFKVRSVSDPTLQPPKRDTKPTTPKTNVKSFFNRFKAKEEDPKEKSLPPLPGQHGPPAPRQRKYYV
ncbi:hypothetical protein Cantr_05221 [Candida viswanathii]|uniref:Uncharacterized protein n=1 Tax=Candida viswanathii TaxID=5486 RepID=A0A367XR85_9ASCO|nr:hypothetical protein Cantr_05221 [Candida viswanathii]